MEAVTRPEIANPAIKTTLRVLRYAQGDSHGRYVSLATTTASTADTDKVDGIEMAPMLPAEDCVKDDARALLAWWQALPRDDHPIPDWDDVDPVSLLPWMGWISLYDVIDGGRDIRYRLVGSRITEQAGVDLTGRLVSQGVYAATPRLLLEHFRRLCERAAPTWTNRVMETQHGLTITHDRIWLPFRRRDVDGVALWLLYLCRLEAGADRLDIARLAGLAHRDPATGLVPVTLNPAGLLRT